MKWGVALLYPSVCVEQPTRLDNAFNLSIFQVKPAQKPHFQAKLWIFRPKTITSDSLS